VTETAEHKPVMHCGKTECRQYILRLDGVVAARGGHVYYASPCGHEQGASTAKDAYERGDPPVFIQDVTGVALISAERRRQGAEEGATEEHDDVAHASAELAWAAWCYLDRATAESEEQAFDKTPPAMWPWEPEAWKPGPTRVRMFIKAGALIAAETDRRLRAGEQP
jgi:hypothetical protein